MPATTYLNRRAWEISNDQLSVTVSVEGGHIASIRHKATGVNPLWTPPWPSMDPSAFSLAKTKEYGDDSESKLLAGILGHNLCLDLFGSPSEEEAAAGMTVHGEASVVPYAIGEEGGALVMRADLPQAALRLERTIRMNGEIVMIRETVENLTAWDRASAWTEHATLGPPFLERGVTQFRAPGTKSKVIENDFTEGKGLQKIGAEFDWPLCPRKDRGSIDLRVYAAEPVTAGFTTTMMDPHRDQAFFMAWHPKWNLLFGYVWKRTDFPWLGRWEENHARIHPPWNGRSLTLGMEFGASPFPESRKKMIERGGLFGLPGYRWIPARKRVTVEYAAFARLARVIPDDVVWRDGKLTFS